MTPRRFASINPSLHPHWIPYSPDLSVIVLSGGRSTRMGQDKATLDLEGETLLERTVRAAQVIGPSRIIVAGPEPRGTAPGSTIRGIPFVREDPPYGGVALSIRAALCELDSLPPRTEPMVPGRSQPQGEDWVLVLPVDLYDPCGAALELVGHRTIPCSGRPRPSRTDLWTAGSPSQTMLPPSLRCSWPAVTHSRRHSTAPRPVVRSLPTSGCCPFTDTALRPGGQASGRA